MTSILDPSNLSQTPILESILERPTFYFTETVKFRLFQQFPNPYFYPRVFLDLRSNFRVFLGLRFDFKLNFFSKSNYWRQF